MEGIYLTIVVAPLAAAVITGLFGRTIGRRASHWICILGVGVSFALSAYVLELKLPKVPSSAQKCPQAPKSALKRPKSALFESANL